MKVVKKGYNERQFELDVWFEFGCIWVSMYEVIRPTWKLFRTRYIDKRIRFLEEFDSVEEAIEDAFASMISKIKTEEETRKKIKEFEEKYLTNN